MAISVAPLSETALLIPEAIPDRFPGTAGLLAVAVLGIVMLHTFNRSLDQHLLTLGVTPEVKQALDQQRPKLAAAETPTNLDSALRQTLKQAVDEAFVAGFRRVTLVCAGLALLSALSAWLLIEGKQVGTKQ